MSEKRSVAEKVRQKHDGIVAMTDAFARDRLNEEYRDLIRRLVDKLARKRPSPLVNGTVAAWAAGAVRAIGWVNFLDDPSRPVHVKSVDIDKAFGISTGTGQAKSKAIRDLLKLTPFDRDWTPPSQMDRNPMAWLVTVNGLVVDVRHMPREVQEEAAARGLIPYLPGSPAGGPKAGGRRSATPGGEGEPRLYTLEVFVTSGLLTDEFVRDNPVISRTIQIRGDQTLADLHDAIFDAFGRFDAHMYEFQFGTGPMDPGGDRYVLPGALGADDGGRRPAGRVDQTTIASLGLKVDQAFGYWFDFGDDWWHQINVVAVDERAPKGKFPRVTKRIGENPPQYPPMDDDGEDDED